MAFVKYFAPSKKLRDPNSPLSRTVPATAIVAANMAVSKLVRLAASPHQLPSDIINTCSTFEALGSSS